MLSAETAAGAYPRLAVEAMQRIITEVEQHRPVRERRAGELMRPRGGHVKTEDAIAAATAAAARMLGAPVIVVFTKSGFTARVVSSYRPDVPILALTDAQRTYHQMALVWGVLPALVDNYPTYDQMVKKAISLVLERKLAESGARVIVTAGHPFDVPGTTNLMKVEVV
jgi:pyruvate kinase